jgi:hypothetical protein
MPEYQVEEAQRSARLNREAGDHATAAGVANQRADDYLLAVVVFAAALFFGGISGKVRPRRQRELLLTLGGVMLIGAGAWVATLPVSFS